MKGKVNRVSLQKLSLSIGDFIRYWGFRRIHGAIWAQLYLSKTPLSCTDLSRNLGVSKALISPALEELVQYKLINEAPAPNDKTKLYFALENVNEVIQQILKTRESVILRRIAKEFSAFSKLNTEDENLDQDRVEKLGEMIMTANRMLEIMLSQKDLLSLPLELDR